MSKQHGARQQKRLAKQKAKREADRRKLARRNSPDPNVRLKDAERWPIAAALVPENLWELGLGNLVIARKMPDGQLACAVFLVDVYCLGVKNALWTVQSRTDFEVMCRKLDEQGRLKSVTPEYFAKLVYRAADYGQSLGFPPHRDFRHAQRLLAGIDPSQCPDEFEFGKDGQPVYIRGPGETVGQARMIVDRVLALGGDFAFPLRDSEILPALPGGAEDAEIADAEIDDRDEDDDWSPIAPK